LKAPYFQAENVLVSVKNWKFQKMQQGQNRLHHTGRSVLYRCGSQSNEGGNQLYGSTA
jgi:hypothetical protein